MFVSSSVLLPGWLPHSLCCVFLVCAGRNKTRSYFLSCGRQGVAYLPHWDQLPVASLASHSPAHPHSTRCLVGRRGDTQLSAAQSQQPPVSVTGHIPGFVEANRNQDVDRDSNFWDPSSNKRAKGSQEKSPGEESEMLPNWPPSARCRGDTNYKK